MIDYIIESTDGNDCTEEINDEDGAIEALRKEGESVGFRSPGVSLMPFIDKVSYRLFLRVPEEVHGGLHGSE